jgi:hypothetical protein
MATEKTISITASARFFGVAMNKAIYGINKLKRALHAYDIAKRRQARKRRRH